MLTSISTSWGWLWRALASASSPELAVMCGAHSVQLVSALLRSGHAVIDYLRAETANWLREQGVELAADESHGARDWLADYRAKVVPFAVGSRLWIDPQRIRAFTA